MCSFELLALYMVEIEIWLRTWRNAACAGRAARGTRCCPAGSAARAARRCARAAVEWSSRRVSGGACRSRSEARRALRWPPSYGTARSHARARAPALLALTRRRRSWESMCMLIGRWVLLVSMYFVIEPKYPNMVTHEKSRNICGDVKQLSRERERERENRSEKKSQTLKAFIVYRGSQISAREVPQRPARRPARHLPRRARSRARSLAGCRQSSSSSSM